uniref:Leucine rich adaptor protein 1 n=1 Tax=Varanus komodoensis TaxID=61221 RepID=A0A8D2IX47_VARKO
MEVPPGRGAELSLPPDLKDLESKVGQRPPDGLLRWLREDPVAHLLRSSPSRGWSHGLGEKIKTLKVELAYLRAIDIKILQQLVAVNEGIEAVKWLLEEKGMLTSHCSSLTSSQYSLAESLETSRRGSWNSLQDPNDKLDSISVGSYLDTLADDMDEYGQGSSVESKAYLERVSSLVKSQSSTEQNRASRLSPPMANGLLSRQVLGLEHLEYDAHWQWVQSQEDVTFL